MPLTITFLGHSGFLLSDGASTLAVDPFLTGNPVAKHKAEQIKCTHIALTHGHADHLGDTVAIAKATGATVYGAFEITEYLGEQGIEKLEPMNPGGQVAARFGFVAMTQAFHSSSYEGRYMGQPGGLVIKMGGATVYHCGDTGLFSDMKLIGELYKPDVAMVPIGDRFTMGPKLATKAAEMIKPKVAIPVHFNTWPPIAQDPKDFNPAGVEVKVMEAGSEWRFG